MASVWRSMTPTGMSGPALSPRSCYGATVRTIFAQPDADGTREQLRQVVAMLEGRYPKAAELLANAEGDVTAYADFPRAHWKKIASTNPLERVNKEIKRRSNVVGTSPTTPPSSASFGPSSPKPTTTGRPPTAATYTKDP
ncbi:MAG: hypothetical protein GEU79_13970 [Acidimicrobiia bacterium]|nr:hypothetical protein [Acidimicrobiia bacterium]